MVILLSILSPGELNFDTLHVPCMIKQVFLATGYLRKSERSFEH